MSAKNPETRLADQSAYLGSPHSFDVCVVMLDPEVSARCAVMFAEQAEAAEGAQERRVLAARAEWWALVAKQARWTR